MSNQALLHDLARAMPLGLTRLDMGAQYIHGKHREFLNDVCLRMASRELDRVIISAPPRHVKTTTLNKYLPAWWLMRWPREDVISASYNANYARRAGIHTRDLVRRWGPVLTGVDVDKEVGAAEYWKTTEGGGMLSAGIGGSATGSGADLFIVDDPVKNPQDARSPTISDTHYDWFRSVAQTRLAPGGVIAIIMTRWSDLDLVGRILEEHRDEWTVINLPAVAGAEDPMGREPGQALWPERYDVQALQRIAREQGPSSWSAMYQGDPVPDGGAILQRRWRRTYEVARNGAFEALDERGAVAEEAHGHECSGATFVDPAPGGKEENDYFAATTWRLTPKRRLLLVDVVHVKAEFTQHLPELRRIYARHPYPIGVERNHAGLALFQVARDEGIPVFELVADADKITRARVAEARFAAGTVHFPRAAPEWLRSVEDEIFRFPYSRHDDLMDTVSYACQWAGRGGAQRASVVRRGVSRFVGVRPGEYQGVK